MKIWLVMIVVGEIGGVAGPLPYDMAECERRRDELRAELDQKFIEHYMWHKGRAHWLVKSDWKYECVTGDVSPEIGFKWAHAPL